MRLHLLPAIAMCAVLLAGCGLNTKPVENSDYAEQQRYRLGAKPDQDSPLFTLGGRGGDQSDSSGSLGVNAYLWRGALETLSFMPLVSADPFGGVIITDWYSPQQSSGERFKATAYILGRQLRSDGVRVSVFRQVQQGGVWVDAPVGNTTATDIENKVLARARELRTQSASGS